MPTHGSDTVAEFVERWERDFKRPRASTNRHNHYMARAFVAEFGERPMVSITRREAREFALRHRGSVGTVRALFNDALDEESVSANPFAKLRLPQSRGRRDLVVLSAGEVRDLADLSLDLFGPYGPTFRSCVLFAAWVGLRPGELFALTWDDVQGDEVLIRRSLGSTGEVTRPKNGRERRVILPPEASHALRSMPRRADTDLVFTTSTGRRFSKTSHFYYWNVLRAAAGRAGMDFYELRHFCATHLLDTCGLSAADVAVQLGHTDGGALVMSVYGHPSEDLARERIRRAVAPDVVRLRAEPRPGEGGRSDCRRVLGAR